MDDLPALKLHLNLNWPAADLAVLDKLLPASAAPVQTNTQRNAAVRA